MFREMRRKKQQLSPEETIALIDRATCAVIGVSGDDGYPYTFPISHAYDAEAGKLYFHSARGGHKIDAITKEAKVSFCVVDKDDVAPAEYTTYFRSAIGFGRAYFVEDETERRHAFWLLAEKFCNQEAVGRFEEVMKSDAPQAVIVAIEVEHLTGKEALELTQQR